MSIPTDATSREAGAADLGRIFGAVVLAAGAAASFTRIARAVARQSARKGDQSIRRQIAKHRTPALDLLSTVLQPAGAPALLILLTGATAFGLRNRGRRAWIPLAMSPILAMSAGRLFTEFLPQQYAPDEGEDGECCFPSGHTTGATAEALTLAYVLSRENLLGAAGATALCALPLATAMNRLYRDRHWTSDILAGWSAGCVIAGLLIALYELLRAENREPSIAGQETAQRSWQGTIV